MSSNQLISNFKDVLLKDNLSFCQLLVQTGPRLVIPVNSFSPTLKQKSVNSPTTEAARTSRIFMQFRSLVYISEFFIYVIDLKINMFLEKIYSVIQFYLLVKLLLYLLMLCIVFSRQKEHYR